MIYNFYDTCSLLMLHEEDFQNTDSNVIVISSITLKELENIKTSAYKDANVKFTARKMLRYLDNYQDNYIIYTFRPSMIEDLAAYDLPDSDDMRILASAHHWRKEISPNDEMHFITNDLALKQIAISILPFGCVKSVEKEENDYSGYVEVQMSDDEMDCFYSNLDKNLYNLLPGQYIIIKDNENNVIDKLCYINEDCGFRNLTYGNFNSKLFGKIKPFKDDVYQALVADSFLNNRITMIRGKSGSGKTCLSLAFLLNQLEIGRIDKIIIFCNTVATKDAARLGFYAGSKTDKLMDSQIGNILASKFGDKMIVEQMINNNKLILLPFSDIRGFDTSGMNAGVYITEAQNLTIELMKLGLQRIGEDSICIIDGDDNTQVDDRAYAGTNNGMKRLSKVFRGADFYGEVELKQIHRSRIAELADKM